MQSTQQSQSSLGPGGAMVPAGLARLRRSGRTIGFIFVLLLLLVMAGAVLRNTQALVDNSRQVTHTYEVLGRLAAMLSTMQDVETGTRGYLLTGNRGFLEPSAPAPAEAARLLQELRGLTADNPAQQLRLGQLQTFVDKKISASHQQVARRERNEPAATQDLVAADEGKRLMDGIRHILDEMRREETGLLQERQARMEASTLRTLLTLGAGLLVSVGVLTAIFLVLRREISRRESSEAALRRNEEDLAVTLNSIGDAVLATDTAGRVTRMNRVAEQLTGWTRAEARGRPAAEVFRIIHEQTRAPAPIPVDDVLATGEIRGLANHTVLVARDGTERPIADSAAPIRDQEGRVIGVVLVFRDVTAEHVARQALRESEERYRTLFNSIDEGFCIIEMLFDAGGNPMDYRFLEINQSFEKQTGLRDAQGKRMREIAPLHEAHWFETYGRIAVTGQPARFQNRAEQLHRTYDVYAFRFGDPEKRQVAILFSDITERKQGEEQIRRLNADLLRHAIQLESANKELEAFSYSVSHDLRAPLRHVQGYVEMLAHEAQSQLSDKARRYLKTIADSAREMGQLIDDLLAFSRMGRTEMREATVDLAGLVTEVRRGLEPAAPDRRVEWKIAPLPRVQGDAAMLRQVLVNLLGNAVKYTRRRSSAEIEIGVAGTEADRVVLFVRDNGAGFDMKYADKLFGVFQRLHRADEFEGTGIGLASVRRILARHGGRIWADARPDAGATFYFTLATAATGHPALPIQS